MPSEHFPSDKPTTSSSESLADDSVSHEQATDQSDTTGSFIRDGGLQLAENLSKIAEHGPEGIQGYLTDILADTEGKVSAAERAAAFSLLAEQQKQAVRQEVIHAGDHMDTTLNASTRVFKETIGQKRGGMRNAVSSFEETARKMRNGNINRRTQEDSMQAGQYILNSVSVMTDARDSWSAKQTSTLDEFGGALSYAKNHESQLKKIGDTLTEEYDGDPVDASKVFRADIIARFARELHSELTTDDSEPSEVITKRLDTPEDTAALETIYTFTTYANQYSSSLNQFNSNKRTDMTQSREAMRHYMIQEATVRLGRSGSAEAEHLHTLHEAPTLLLKGIDKLAEQRNQLHKQTQFARETNTARQSAVEATAVKPVMIESAPEMSEKKPQQEVTFDVVTEEVQKSEAAAKLEQASSPAVESTQEPVETITEEPVIESVLPSITEELVQQPVTPEPAPKTTTKKQQPNYASANGSREIIDPNKATNATEQSQEPTIDYIKKSSPNRATQEPRADTFRPVTRGKKESIGPEPLRFEQPQPQKINYAKEPAPSPYQAGHVRRSTRQESNPVSDPGVTLDRAEARGVWDAARNRHTAQQVNSKQPLPRIARPGDTIPNSQREQSEPLYGLTPKDITEIRQIIKQQAAEAAKRQPDQTPAWIQLINNPTQPRKSREERFYESRTGRFLINMGSRAVRAGRFLRRHTSR